MATFTAARELIAKIAKVRGHAKVIALKPGMRVFLVSDELAAKTLHDWSEPLQIRLEAQEDGTYDLIARVVELG